MESEKIVEVVIRPFGEGGAELGMTRAEMLEHIDQLGDATRVVIDGSVDILFAWLVAIFFIAHRLSRKQFLAACGIYFVICIMRYSWILNIGGANRAWTRYAGFHSQSNPTLLEQASALLSGGYGLSFLYWGLWAVSIWWAVVCRRNQPHEIGSPL